MFLFFYNFSQQILDEQGACSKAKGEKCNLSLNKEPTNVYTYTHKTFILKLQKYYPIRFNDKSLNND